MELDDGISFDTPPNNFIEFVSLVLLIEMSDSAKLYPHFGMSFPVISFSYVIDYLIPNTYPDKLFF